MRSDNRVQGQPDNLDKEQVNIEVEAARKAKKQVSSGIWNLQIVIFSYAITIAIIIMVFKGVELEIMTASAIFGLSIISIWGRLRYKRLYNRLYQNEIRHLHELEREKNSNSLEVNNPAIEKTAILQTVASPLTTRQKEILSLIAEGNSNKQIAAYLNLSERTIKNQLGYVFKKLHVADRTRAVVLSIRNGWILSEVNEY